MDAAERVVASAQPEVSRADDDAQRVHAELDHHRRSSTVKELSLRLVRCRVLLMRAPLVNWKTPRSNGRLWPKRLGRRSERLRDALKERESAKEIAHRSGQLDATAAALEQAVVVAPVAGVVVGRKGEPGQPEHEPADELFVIATGGFDFEIPGRTNFGSAEALRPGQAVLVIVSDVPNSGYAGAVKGIAKN